MSQQELNIFTTRIRQLILHHRALREENAELHNVVEEKDKKLAGLTKELENSRRDYENLKMAKMLEITNADLEGAEKRLSKLIRKVDKCITLLSAQQD